MDSMTGKKRKRSNSGDTTHAGSSDDEIHIIVEDLTGKRHTLPFPRRGTRSDLVALLDRQEWTWAGAYEIVRMVFWGRGRVRWSDGRVEHPLVMTEKPAGRPIAKAGDEFRILCTQEEPPCTGGVKLNEYRVETYSDKSEAAGKFDGARFVLGVVSTPFTGLLKCLQWDESAKKHLQIRGKAAKRAQKAAKRARKEEEAAS